MPVLRLNKDSFVFPNTIYAEDDGLLAVGGDLRIERLLAAYKKGIFPWYSPGSEILWWCPKERFVIFPEKIKISRSMKKLLKKNIFGITFNKAFEEVIHKCRIKREFEEGTWITDDMEKAYCDMFAAGYGFSVEVWNEDKIVGGLYGVKIGKCMFGESMFSDMANSSKAALICLAKKAASEGILFIDCQLHTDHLESMGGEYISYREYIDMIGNDDYINKL